jgi:hypothetical protein
MIGFPFKFPLFINVALKNSSFSNSLFTADIPVTPPSPNRPIFTPLEISLIAVSSSILAGLLVCGACLLVRWRQSKKLDYVHLFQNLGGDVESLFECQKFFFFFFFYPCNFFFIEITVIENDKSIKKILEKVFLQEKKSRNFSETFQDIRFKGTIAKGGQAEVFRAIYSNQTVAAKSALFGFDKNSMEEFLREIQLLNSLHHPNIIQFLGVVVSRAHSKSKLKKKNFSWEIFFCSLVSGRICGKKVNGSNSNVKWSSKNDYFKGNS